MNTTMINPQIIEKKELPVAVHTVIHNEKAHKACNLYFLLLLTLMLSACATAATPTPDPRVQGIPPESHVPVILGVRIWQDGFTPEEGAAIMKADMTFTDPGGDVVLIESRLVSTTLPEYIPPQSIPIKVSAEAQKGEAHRIIEMGQCGVQFQSVYEMRLRDSAGNLSEPVELMTDCPAPAKQTRQNPWLWMGIAAGLVVASASAGIRWRPGRKVALSQTAPHNAPPASYASWILSALSPALLFLFASVQWSFLGSFIHEGGHTLPVLAAGGKITSFVFSPFAFQGYARPASSSIVWGPLSGPLVEFSIALVFFLLLWKRRSARTLPLLMLLPYCLIWLGIAALMAQSDIYNLFTNLGLPGVLAMGVGALLLLAGLGLVCMLLPLFGLAPGDRRAYFALPAANLVIGILSLVVVHLFVPGSPRLQADSMVESTLYSADIGVALLVALGLLLAAVYSIVYRRIYRHLPAGLQTPVTQPTLKDLRIHSALFAFCLVLGLAVLPW